MVSDSLGLVDFAVGLVNSVLNLPDRRVIFLGGEFKLQKNCNQSCSSNFFWASTCYLQLAKWQAVKLTFFAPWLSLHHCYFVLLHFIGNYH